MGHTSIATDIAISVYGTYCIPQPNKGDPPKTFLKISLITLITNIRFLLFILQFYPNQSFLIRDVMLAIFIYA